jgi:hypothetical protein
VRAFREKELNRIAGTPVVLALTCMEMARFAALTIGCSVIYTIDAMTQEDSDKHTIVVNWFKKNFEGYMDLVDRSSTHQSMTKSTIAYGHLLEERETDYKQVRMVKDVDELADIIRHVRHLPDIQSAIEVDEEATLARRDFEARFHNFLRNDSIWDPEVVKCLGRYNDMVDKMGVDFGDDENNLEYVLLIRLFLKSGYGPLVTITKPTEGSARPTMGGSISRAALCLMKDHIIMDSKHLVISPNKHSFVLGTQQQGGDKSVMIPNTTDTDLNTTINYFEPSSGLTNPHVPYFTSNRQSKEATIGWLLANTDERLWDATNTEDYIAPKSERKKLQSAAAEGEEVQRKVSKRKANSSSTGEGALMKASKKAAKAAQELVKTDSTLTKSTTVKATDKNPTSAKPVPSSDASESSEEDSDEDSPAPKRRKKSPT